MRSYTDVLELIRRGMARHNLVNRLNATSRTQAHIVLVYTFTQVLSLSPAAVTPGLVILTYVDIHLICLLTDLQAFIGQYVYQCDVTTVCLRLITGKH